MSIKYAEDKINVNLKFKGKEYIKSFENKEEMDTWFSEIIKEK